jgi:hypothetical protein
VSERRAAKRYPVEVPIAGWDSKSKCFEGRTRDLSTSGVYMHTNQPMKTNERFLMLTGFPGRVPDDTRPLMWAHCRVVRVEPRRVDGGGFVGIAAVIEEYTMAATHSGRPRGAVQMAVQSA